MTDKSAINILAVDDEPFMLKLLTRTLTNLGYTTFNTCEGALAALEMMDFAPVPPDLILLDLNMPDMDGVEFVRYLVKRDFPGSVVLVSGEDERVLQAVEKLAQAHEINVLGHLRKPVRPNTLAAILDKWMPASGRKASAAKKTFSAEEVHAAIVNGELVNYYQPKVSLVTGHVVGAETLVRWKHSSQGIIYPDQFISVAEANGLIHRLTRAVIAGAFKDAQNWRDREGVALQIAVNVSMDDLASLDFVDYIAGQAAISGIAPKDVTLEVTESRLMQDLRSPLEVLARLRIKRFRISIDDFGTGHSSLAQLRDIPFDELKIDRGFVKGAWNDSTVRAIFDASVALAKQLSMGIVAEGVEDRADWDFVRRSGCDLAQGYFIARPMSADAMRDWAEDWEDRALTMIG